MNSRTVILTLGVVLVAAAAAVYIFYASKKSGRYIYLEGTVTAYDVTPTYTDGGIIFRINNTSVDIGGGLRAAADKPSGYVYGPIKVGDKVKAKVLQTQPGYYSVYGCPECYVEK